MGRRNKLKDYGFGTRAVNIGQQPDKETGAIVPPIFLSSTYDQKNIKNPSYFYSRGENPNRFSLEESLATLEKANFCLAFSSGQAAAMSVLNTLLNPTDHVLIVNDVYGGTDDLFKLLREQNNINTTSCIYKNYSDIKESIKLNTKLIWVETPSNPTLKIVDIKELSEIAHSRNIKIIVDNTFMSPYLQNPLKFGADFIVHSTTKFISGHQDVLGGAVMLDNERYYEKMKSYQKTAGAVPSPFDCWLINRGIKTLHIRIEKQVKNAMKIAQYLEKQNCIERVLYPGLTSFRQKNVVKKQMKGFGSIISFYFKGNPEKFIEALELFPNAVSLGGIKSLICNPYNTTHRLISEEKKHELGITQNLLRISVGIEDVDDLINDLSEAMSVAI